MDNKKEITLKKEVLKDLKEIMPRLEVSTAKILKAQKNFVILITLNNPKLFPKEIVVKKISSKNFKIEYENLISNYQNGILVPKILAYRKPYIIMERIEGLNLCDILNEDLENMMGNGSYLTKKEIFEKLADWLKYYHETNIVAETGDQILVRNKGDLRLKNFIFHEKEIYGIDFENVHEGIPENDIAEIIISIITTSPGDIFQNESLEFKLNLIYDFLLRYLSVNTKFFISYNKIIKAMHNYLRIVAKRRHIDYVEEDLNKKTKILLKKIKSVF